MLKKFIFLFAVILFALSAVSAQEETEPANDSAITGTQIPAGALRVLPSSYPKEIDDAFEDLVSASKGKVSPGKREVLVWAQNYKKSVTSDFIKKIQTEWQTNGWKYEMGGRDGDLEVFGLYSEQPNRRAVLGFFVQGDDALVLSLLEVLPLSAENTNASAVKTKMEKPVDANNSIKNSAAKILDVGRDEGFVNVMGGEMPAMPTFPALKPKAGFVRGYVKDWTGKPLPNAAIGVRASYFAGTYSGAQGKTDAKGFYEFAVPKGSAHFYNAGYALEWGDGLAALGLHPADGNLESFVTSDGAVENFVLLPYGITSRENVQNNSLLASSYYGGSLHINYYAHEKDDNRPMAGSIVENSILEITLTPEDSSGQTIVVRNTIGFRGNFKINNIPLGRYQISAKVGGKSMNLKQTGTFDPSSPFGMKPRETNGAASVLFKPGSASANMVSPQAGGWDSVAISVAQP